MRIVLTSAYLAAIATVLAACSSVPVAPPTVAVAKPTAIPASKPAVAPAVSTNTALPAYLDPSNPLFKERSVYFGFDDFSVTKNFTGTIERHGQYLASHPSVAIKVEGNSDERGSTEYNLALGQKRAEAVVHALKVYGVKDAQLEAVSWGKEKPKASGHDEAAWAQNRRADLDYSSK
jgi:peptidoglycan-associated lipoprotein